MWTAFGNRYHQQVTSAPRQTCCDLTNLHPQDRLGAPGSRFPGPEFQPPPYFPPPFPQHGAGAGTPGPDMFSAGHPGSGHHLQDPYSAGSLHCFQSPSQVIAKNITLTFHQGAFFRIPSEPVSGMSRSGERCTGVTRSRFRITPWASITRLTSTRPGRASWGRGAHRPRSGSPLRRS